MPSSLGAVAFGQTPAPTKFDPNTTVELEYLTHNELRAKQKAGVPSVLLIAGGTEQRGPQNVLGGHTIMSRYRGIAIAKQLGNAFLAPVVPFAPQPTGLKENTDQPRFQRVSAFGGIPACSEGWGLYTEKLAEESHWYHEAPIGLLGQLDAELFRARRIGVDTGLHAKRWTRQQAIDYGIEASEIERYVVFPGQACSYMIGQLKILELRDRAKAQLKDRFSERAFHNAVLAPGGVPLAILEQEVERYIRGARN